MCNTTTVPTVTLQTAILLQVKEFAEQGKKFSAHDITAQLRSKCNNGQMEIPEIEDVSGQDGFRYNVQHNAVRTLFNEMRDNGVFDSDFQIRKQFNGMFFEYVADAVNQGATPMTPVTPTVMTPSVSPTPVVTPSTPSTTGVLTSDIKVRVENYLENCATRNFRPSLKNVQSAIKRGNKSTGISSAVLLDYIQNELGYSISYSGRNIKHTQIITV